jgi:hypothetical protein
MLAQQTPKWICRLCLSAKTRPIQYRGLTQSSGAGDESAENNVSRIHPNGESTADKPVPRIPLRELLEARRMEDDAAKPEPLDKSRDFKKSGASKDIKSLEIPHGSDKATTDSQKLPFNVKSPQRHHSMRYATNVTAQKVAKQSIANKSETQSKPSPDDTSTATADNEPIRSLRAKNLDKDNTPLPFAPTTRILNKTSHQVKRKVPLHWKATAKSPLNQIRAREYKLTQTVADPKIHPADPLNSFPAFPGTAAREVITEQVVSNKLEHLERIWSEDIKLTPVQPKEKRPIPVLEHGLDRVLFKYVLS